MIVPKPVEIIKKYTMFLKDKFEKHFDTEQQNEYFAAWAFGEDYLKFESSLQFMNAWNKLHGDMLMLKPEQTINECVLPMTQIYKKI